MVQRLKSQIRSHLYINGSCFLVAVGSTRSFSGLEDECPEGNGQSDACSGPFWDIGPGAGQDLVAKE